MTEFLQSAIWYMGIIAAIVVVIPLTVFLSVKLGTYAFYRARHIFNKEIENGEESSL